MSDLALLTVAEAAGQLRVKRLFIYQLVQGGLLGSVRLGKRAIRIPRQELDTFIEKRRQPASERVEKLVGVGAGR